MDWKCAEEVELGRQIQMIWREDVDFSVDLSQTLAAVPFYLHRMMTMSTPGRQTSAAKSCREP